MATDTQIATPAKVRRSEAPSEPLDGVRHAISSATGSARSIAAETADRVPEAIDTARSAVERADSTLRSASDTTLTVGAALSFGLALGLLIGGSNRLLVAAALLPVGVMAIDLADRTARRSRRAGKMQDT